MEKETGKRGAEESVRACTVGSAVATTTRPRHGGASGRYKGRLGAGRCAGARAALTAG